MIKIKKAHLEDVEGIIDVCSKGYRHTYPGLLPRHHIEKTIKEFYNKERIKQEILHPSQEWNGWFVAVDDKKVVGAGGGGLIDSQTAELFVLYLDPDRKREGIGSRLLEVITQDQIKRGAREQSVSVAKGNTMGIPFYEAAGFDCQGERPSYNLPEDEGFESLWYRRDLKNF